MTRILKKTTKISYLLLIVAMLGLTAVSCSKDKEPDNTSSKASMLIGNWSQTNDYGTTITITFKSNGSGSIHYLYSNGNSSTEPFEYTTRTDSDENLHVYISSNSQLYGDYVALVTKTTLTLKGYINGEYGTYPFTRS